jgi:hypothetical protein
MATVIDSYNESNADSSSALSSSIVCRGQAFTAIATYTELDSVKFLLQRVAGASGTIQFEIYAHTGTFGSTSKPTGSALAISESINVTTIPTASPTLITLNFYGANRITLTSGTKYCVVARVVSFSGTLYFRQDFSSPTHAGCAFYYFSGAWSTQATGDSPFYVYGVVPGSSSAVKTVQGLAKASVKTINGLAIASVKTINGLT